MFNFEQALAQNTRLVAERKRQRGGTTYVLFYSNDARRYDGKLTGSTVKSLIAQFRETYGTYKYAMITKLNDDKVVRLYNRDLGKTFSAPGRTGRKGRKVKAA